MLGAPPSCTRRSERALVPIPWGVGVAFALGSWHIAECCPCSACLWSLLCKTPPVAGEHGCPRKGWVPQWGAQICSNRCYLGSIARAGAYFKGELSSEPKPRGAVAQGCSWLLGAMVTHPWEQGRPQKAGSPGQPSLPMGVCRPLALLPDPVLTHTSPHVRCPAAYTVPLHVQPHCTHTALLRMLQPQCTCPPPPPRAPLETHSSKKMCACIARVTLPLPSAHSAHPTPLYHPPSGFIT